MLEVLGVFCCVFTISESLGLFNISFNVSFKQTQTAYEEQKALAL